MRAQLSAQRFGSLIQQTDQPRLELVDVGFDQVWSIVVGLLDLIAQAKTAFELLQQKVFPLLMAVDVELD